MTSDRDWSWEGDRPALDLVNTFRDRKTGGRELLQTPPDLAEWLRTANAVRRRPTVDHDQLTATRQLRSAVARCVDAALAGNAYESADVRVINRWAGRRRPVRLREEAAVETVRGADPVTTALAEIATDAVVLLGGADRATLRVCAAADCGLRFVDRSPAGGRQWCSMSRCGNRAKARAHRERSRH